MTGIVVWINLKSSIKYQLNENEKYNNDNYTLFEISLFKTTLTTNFNMFTN